VLFFRLKVSANCGGILHDRCVYIITFCILGVVIFLLMVQQCTQPATAKLPSPMVPFFLRWPYCTTQFLLYNCDCNPLETNPKSCLGSGWMRNSLISLTYLLSPFSLWSSVACLLNAVQYSGWWHCSIHDVRATWRTCCFCCPFLLADSYGNVFSTFTRNMAWRLVEANQKSEGKVSKNSGLNLINLAQ
jgi:hypothetical protein